MPAATSPTALRNVGAPTTWHEWRDVGTVAGVAALVAMLLGSILGGSLGDRWHTKFLARAIDPTVGPEAAMSGQAADRARDADAAHLGAEQRVARTQGRNLDPAVAATAVPAMDERRDRREARMTEERRGLADPSGRDVNLRDDPAAAGAAGETRSERLADERAADSERVGAGGVGETRSERMADERAADGERVGAGGLGETRSERMADERAADGERVGAGGLGENRRERVADERMAGQSDGGAVDGGVEETRQQRVTDDRAVATEERGYGNGAGAVEPPKRSFMDRLRGR